MVQKDSIKKQIIIICGATATGKSALAVECAKLLDSEIISADSMYIYKRLDIGTAKPTAIEMDGVKHHLIDVVEPCATFTVSDYKALAEKALNEIFTKGKIPIICGGTGFYINSILYDLSYGNGNSNPEVREKYKDLAAKFGNEYVFEILKEKDPISAEKLHYNDLKRVIRALEIYESGIKKSDIIDDYIPKYDFDAYSISFPRETLYDRINFRVDKMIEQGLIEEVKKLTLEGLNINNQCMQGIGYKEVLDFIDGKCGFLDMVELIKLNTRHYAKRQITYFKKMPNLVQLQSDDIKKLAKRIVAKYD